MNFIFLTHPAERFLSRNSTSLSQKPFRALSIAQNCLPLICWIPGLDIPSQLSNDLRILSGKVVLFERIIQQIKELRTLFGPWVCRLISVDFTIIG
jgi:hypothetical protein